MAGSGAAVTYASTVSVVPLTADLGGTSQFLAGNYAGSLVAGATNSFAFLLTPSEVASTTSGTVLVGIEVDSAAGSSMQPAVPAIAGLTPLVQHLSADSAFGLFAVSRASLELLQVSGANAVTTGAYTLQVFIAGDANQDGAVNGLDAALVASLIGTTVGEPGYIAAADANRDGVIDVADVQIVAANLGFQETLPPVVQPATTMTHVGLPVQFDLAPQAADPQGDTVFFRVVSADGGTATLNPDGHTVTFVPDAGFSGTADFQFQADNGLEIAAPATITIDVSAAPLVSLDFQKREPRLAVGGGTQIIVVGDFSDQSGVVLDPSYLTFQSTSAATATVSADGALVGVAQGTCILTVSAQGLEAVTAVTVGQVSSLSAIDQQLYNQGLNVYPPSVSLSSNGGTRQIDVHPGGDVQLTTNLGPAATGTQYFLSQPGVVTVSSDGLLTAVAPGTVTVTVINGPAESLISVLVQVPQTGTVTLGAAGGVVEGSDGSIVAVPPGDFPQATPVSIVPLTLADLPQGVPAGFGYAAAFQLNIGDQTLNVPVQLSIPVAPGIPAGTTVVFYRAGETVDDTGKTVPIWWESEDGLVGTDGMAHTASPPEHGSHSSGEYLVVETGLSTFSPIDITVNIANIAANAFAANLEFGGGGSALAGIAASVIAGGIDATMAFPIVPQPEPLLLEMITPVGLPTLQTLGNVMIDPDTINTFTTTITAPPLAAGATPPIITNILEDINTTDPPTWPKGTTATAGPYPEVVITGTNFTTPNPGQSPPAISDLQVIFQMPGANGIQEVVTPSASSTDTELHAQIPDDVVVGLCQITVVRPDTIDVRGSNDDIMPQTSPTYSNAAQLSTAGQLNASGQATGAGQYVFVTEPEASYQTGYVAGAVLVLNGDPDAKNPDGTSAFNQVVATIPLGVPGTTPNPIQVAVTPDNTRAYVTEYGSGSVAVIDAISLQEVDVNSEKMVTPAPYKPSDWQVSGVRLDPNLDGDLITTSIPIYCTVNVPGASWALDLISRATGVDTSLGSGSAAGPIIHQVLATLDPTNPDFTDGTYTLKLTATTADGASYETDIWVDLSANPVQKAIMLPDLGDPYGIAIDPQGNYAYVVGGLPFLINGERTTLVYQIDVNPASPTYNEVVKTFPLGQSDSPAQTAEQNIAPNGGRQVTVSADGLHVYITAPNWFTNSSTVEPPTFLSPNAYPDDLQNGNLIEITLSPLPAVRRPSLRPHSSRSMPSPAARRPTAWPRSPTPTT